MRGLIRHGLRLSVVLTLVMVLPSVLVGAAQGDPTCDGEWVTDPVTGRVVCRGSTGGGGSGGGPGGGDGGGSSPPTTAYPYRELWVPVLRDGPDGTCLDTTTERLGRDPSDSEEISSEIQFLRWLRVYPLCPDATPPPATTPPLEAASFLHAVDLPLPAPYIQPGRLPVGLDAFLETGAPTSVSYGPRNTPFGDLILNVEAQIFVDWDDPHDEFDGEQGPYTVGSGDSARPARPGPHPDGEISHLYQYDGLYEVRVRYEWTANWTIGTEYSGTITGLETSGVYPAPGFEVFSRQAVG